ncbi:MAG TPA: thiamine pyrophosphate-dependent enzyme [Candidatus Dormibacteraeota bacterium]|nr:thiamine pyrophosphate-dependent enzyme [Candidatus Dormibacteraeota bacterium]
MHTELAGVDNGPVTPTGTAITGADLLVDALYTHGIKVVFGLPGVQLDPVFDALARRLDQVRVYHTRHEQATSYMADGYARAGGELGCCLVVPGPGLLNAMSGLATAHACSSPVLCVAGQVQSDQIDSGRGLLHEIPHQLEMVRSVVKWSGRAMRPDEVPGLVAEAVRQMRTGRPRPVAIEVPPDVLEALSDSPPARVDLNGSRPRGDHAQLEQVASILNSAERPLIVAGGGVLQSAAWDELAGVAERLSAPVLLSGNAKGALSARHPLAFEGLTAPHLVKAADVILAVATRFATGGGSRWRLRPDQRLLRVDADPEELVRDVQPAVAVEADAKAALGLLADLLPGRTATAWRGLDELRRRCSEELASLEPQASFGAAIRQALPDDAIVIDGMTQVGYWCRVGFPVYEPRTFLTAGYQGTLGFELPTGLGAQVARPDRRVVVIAGDGGFLFNVQELATAVQHGIPVITVIFNDNGFGNVRRTQRQRFGRLIASDLHNPDFVQLAEAFGVAGHRANGPDGLGRALLDALDDGGPSLIEVPVGEMEDPWPLLMRMRTTSPAR